MKYSDVKPGQQILYTNSGSRHGWVGTIVQVTHSHFIVDYPKACEDTTYSSRAFCQTKVAVSPEIIDNSYGDGGYLIPIVPKANVTFGQITAPIELEPIGDDFYMICCEHKNWPKRYATLEEASTICEQKARDSESGQKYYVIQSLEIHQRKPAPMLKNLIKRVKAKTKKKN